MLSIWSACNAAASGSMFCFSASDSAWAMSPAFTSERGSIVAARRSSTCPMKNGRLGASVAALATFALRGARW